MKNKKKMKFLSESILLEESGLPMINTIVIVSVTTLIILFLAWANMLIMEESIELDGQVVINENDLELLGFVRTNNFILVSENADVFIDIPGITNRKSLKGSIVSINTIPKYDIQNNAYYEVKIKLTESDEEIKELSNILVTGMESQVKVVTGTRTMLQYLLGTLYDTGKDAFNIK